MILEIVESNLMLFKRFIQHRLTFDKQYCQNIIIVEGLRLQNVKDGRGGHRKKF